MDRNGTYLYACLVHQKIVWVQPDLRSPSSGSNDFFDLVKIVKSSDYFPFAIFVLKLYIMAWYRCTNAIECPNQDLSFIRSAFEFSSTDKIISVAIIEKIKNHLWYLTPDTVGLAFFDPNVSLETKRKMVDRL